MVPEKTDNHIQAERPAIGLAFQSSACCLPAEIRTADIASGESRFTMKFKSAFMLYDKLVGGIDIQKNNQENNEDEIIR